MNSRIERCFSLRFFRRRVRGFSTVPRLARVGDAADDAVSDSVNVLVLSSMTTGALVFLRFVVIWASLRHEFEYPLHGPARVVGTNVGGAWCSVVVTIETLSVFRP